MGNLVTAIDGLIALTELSRQLAEEIAAAGATIRAAQSEGRDLSEAELERFERARQAAVAAWDTRHAEDAHDE